MWQLGSDDTETAGRDQGRALPWRSHADREPLLYKVRRLLFVDTIVSLLRRRHHGRTSSKRRELGRRAKNQHDGETPIGRFAWVAGITRTVRRS